MYKDFKWIRMPKSFSVREDKLFVETAPKTDLWQRTYYHFRNDNAPVFQMITDKKFFSFTVKTAGDADRFGISLVRGTDSKKYYTIVVNPEDNNNKRKINFEEEGEEGKGFIDGIDGYLFDRPADNTYHVTICTDNSVCVVYINDNVAYTNRIYGMQKNPWSINSYSGTVEVSAVKVSYY